MRTLLRRFRWWLWDHEAFWDLHVSLRQLHGWHISAGRFRDQIVPRDDWDGSDGRMKTIEVWVVLGPLEIRMRHPDPSVQLF